MLPMIGAMALGSLMAGGGKGGGTQVSTNVTNNNSSSSLVQFNPVINANSERAASAFDTPASIIPEITSSQSSGQDMRGGVDPNMGLSSPNAEYISDSTAPSGAIDTGMFGGNSMIIYTAIAGVLIIILMRRKA